VETSQLQTNRKSVMPADAGIQGVVGEGLSA